MKYAAREVNGLWSICTSSNLICSHLPMADALDALSDALGIDSGRLVSSPASVFLATQNTALTYVVGELTQRLEDSVAATEKTEKSLLFLVEQLNERFKNMAGDSKLQRNLLKCERAWGLEFEALKTALVANGCSQDLETTATILMRNTETEKQLSKLRRELENE